MAKSKGQAENEIETETDAEVTMDTTPPAGFRRVNSVSDAPWVKNVAGNVVYGGLINRYKMQGNPTGSAYYYQVELLRPCMVTIGKGEDAEVKAAPAGTVVNLGESKQIESLKEIIIPEINAGAEYNIWAKFGKKIKISGARQMWPVDLQSKKIRPPSSPVIPLPVDADSEVPAGESPF
jgi:hypothetical protein